MFSNFTMKRLVILLILLSLFVVPNAGCRLLNRLWNGKPSQNIPPMTPPMVRPTLESLIYPINNNTAAIASMKAERASLNVPGAPIALNAKLYFERPRRFRLQGQAMSLGSRDLDFGSNDQIFWLWSRQFPGEMYYCRHDQFPESRLRSVFPIEPEWIIEALGMVEFRPHEQHSGPFEEPDGNWRIDTLRQTAVGQFRKQTIIDAKMGWVIRQELYSPQNERVAMAAMSQHDYDKINGIYYARRIEIQCQGTEGVLTINLGKPEFNLNTPLSTLTFEMPQYDGVQTVDICSPELQYRQGAIMPAQPSLPQGTQAGSVPASSPPPVTMPPVASSVLPSTAMPVYSEAHLRTVVR